VTFRLHVPKPTIIGNNVYYTTAVRAGSWWIYQHYDMVVNLVINVFKYQELLKRGLSSCQDYYSW